MDATSIDALSAGRFEPSQAAAKYLEQYGDPIVTNTYLKLTIFILSLVCFAVLILLYRAQARLNDRRPVVIRINDIGRAEAVDYQSLAYRPQEAESRYFLSQWAVAYYGRNHYTLERDFPKALYFLSSDLQGAIIARSKKSKTIAAFVGDSSQPNVDVEIKNVAIEDLRQAPYKARIEFYKIFSSVLDHNEQKRELWTASVVYLFRDQVPNEVLPFNPLGLTITYFREDQAFQE